MQYGKYALVSILAACALCACGAQLHGTYAPPDGLVKFAFKSRGRVELTALGQTRVGSYTLEDGKVYITTGTETQVFAFDKHGCIDGGFAFGKLCKR